jgi:mono/diheme cytochrome c family protein
MEFYMKKLIISVVFLTTTNLIADIEAGEQVYKANCAICHTVNGGSAMGSDFNMVSYTRKKTKIEQYAKDPYSLYKEFGYSANAMPTLPLEEQEFKDVADYISSLQPFKKWMIQKKMKKKVLVNNLKDSKS